MNLTTNVAQRIVDYIGANLDVELWVTDEVGHLIAGTKGAACGSDGSICTESAAWSQRLTTNSQNDFLPLTLTYAQQPLGVLYVANHSQKVQAVAGMVKSLAEMMISQIVAVENLGNRQKMVDRLVYNLLHSSNNKQNHEAIAEEAGFLGIDIEQPRVAVVIDISVLLPDPPSLSDSKDVDEKAIQHAKQTHNHVLRYAAQTLSTTEGTLFSFTKPNLLTSLLVVEPEKLEEERALLESNLTRFAQVVGAPQGLCAGFGEYYAMWQDLGRSYDDACVALEMGRRLHEKETMFGLSDIGLVAYIFTRHADSRTNLTKRLLNPLLKQQELFDTLAIFLNANLSASTAAERLHIHRHTLAYRLNRIASLTGQDPRNFQAAALFWAAYLWYIMEL